MCARAVGTRPEGHGCVPELHTAPQRTHQVEADGSAGLLHACGTPLSSTRDAADGLGRGALLGMGAPSTLASPWRPLKRRGMTRKTRRRAAAASNATRAARSPKRGPHPDCTLARAAGAKRHGPPAAAPRKASGSGSRSRTCSRHVLRHARACVDCSDKLAAMAARMSTSSSSSATACATPCAR